MQQIIQSTRPAGRRKSTERQSMVVVHHTMSPIGYTGLNEADKKKYLLFGDSGGKVAPEKIADVVCEYFGVNRLDLNVRCNARQFVTARQICMYFISKMTDLKPIQIATMFRRDRTTFIYAVNTVEDLIETDKRYKQQINEIKELLAE